MKYIDAEKLISKIEALKRRKGFLPFENTEITEAYMTRGVQFTCDDIVNLIQSLQQEQPEVDLEEVADHYEQTKATELACKYGWGEADIRKQCFIAGANWQKEQDGKIKN